MKRIIAIFAALLIIVLIAGVFTNPSYEDYKIWVKEELKNQYAVETGKTGTTQLEDSLSNFFVDMFLDASVLREDHKIYSMYNMKSEEGNFIVLGLFNKFFVLEDSTGKSTGTNTRRIK